VVLLDYEPGGIEHAAVATRSGGELSFRFVEDAIAQALTPREHPLHADAIVTAPINKAAWAKAGHKRFHGHTELLAERCKSERFGMMFHANAGENAHALNVILASAHVPLMDVRNVLTIGKVVETIDLGHQACKALGIRHPRVAVCGLNPHAGEGGILGDEEERIIAPAIRISKENGIDATGPHPGDTVFIPAMHGRYDLVVAMYHDQGLIPLKLLARDRAVNMTVGLPIIRTSPDHGTAFDIAGSNTADPGSMRSAIDLALKLVAAPHGSH
jgi:4-hydroxythreonine-4-phosphate dehydrogenase